jgi:Uma2 family endonuclease
MRSPRLTRVSEGKPFRRLRLNSKAVQFVELVVAVHDHTSFCKLTYTHSIATWQDPCTGHEVDPSAAAPRQGGNGSVFCGFAAKNRTISTVPERSSGRCAEASGQAILSLVTLARTAKDTPMAIDINRTSLRLSWIEGDDLIISLDPLQGHWSEEQYLLLSNQTNRLIEYTDGVIEVLPMPTDKHQVILEFLFLALRAVVRTIGGKVLFAPLRLQVRPGKYREPDILLVRDANDPRRQNEYWRGADLVVEIVSPDRPDRDIAEKPIDYAEGGVPEYWIVNPLNDTITVLVLEGDTYAEHGVFQRGDEATSTTLAGFAVSVDAVFDAE